MLTTLIMRSIKNCLSVLIYFMPVAVSAQQYRLVVKTADKDTSFKIEKIGIQTTFKDQYSATVYISNLPKLLLSKGYPAASVDAVYYDSTKAFVQLYLGLRYAEIKISYDSVPRSATAKLKLPKSAIIKFDQIAAQKHALLNYYEANGYPFAEVLLDSIQFDDGRMQALLKVNEGPLYHIDSIRVYGTAKINNKFLQRYLSVSNASIYNNTKLQAISKKIAELPYLQEQQPWNITMLGSGSILNLFLLPKRSSRVNALVGILPSNVAGEKTQITGDVNLNLVNALASGETISVMWQKLQKQSPRLNLGYEQPYIFNSNFGVDLLFDLYKKDSAFVQVNGRAAVQYLFSAHQNAKIFLQTQRNILLAGGYNVDVIRALKQLPQNIDVSTNSFGLDYSFINTNYKFNPRSGNEFNITAATGIRKIRRNNDITSLKDPANPAFNFNSLYDSIGKTNYQLNVKMQAARYFPSGKRSTFKTAMHAAIISSENLFKNELYRLGGYKLLRGFDEETILADRYAVATIEFRYLTGLNSFIFLFSDAAVTRTRFQNSDFANRFLSSGVGLSFETKVGLLNISYAIGSRDDVTFNLRQASKIHFGYINYF